MTAIAISRGLRTVRSDRLKRIVTIVIAGTALAAAGILLAPRVYPWFEPQILFFDVHGIDVSHHQGSIDWPAVASDDVGFAFIKATEGGDHVDRRFEENWIGAAKAGIPRGAYHFFTQCRPGGVQADHFIRTVPKDSAALAHAIDAEHMGRCRKYPQVKDVVREITVFLDKLEKHYGRRPLIYTTREFHDTYLKTRFPNETFWIRSLILPPRYRSSQWTIWQFHNRGRRAGITGPVDLNVLRDGSSFF